MKTFKARIEIIGVNPFVFMPPGILKSIFDQAEKDKGPIPVRGAIDGHAFIQTLVKYSGAWRLYINGSMLKSSGKKVGDSVTIAIEFDPDDRTLPMPPRLEAALKSNKEAKKAFEQLSPSRQKEIIRYISYLKTDAAVDKNVARAIQFLTGKERFVGRDRP